MNLSNPSSLPTGKLILAVALGLTLAGCKPADPESAPAPAATAASSAEEAGATTAIAAPTVLTELVAEERDGKLLNTGMCSMDTVDGARFSADAPSELPDPGAARFTGWVLDDALMARPDAPKLRVDSSETGRSWEIGLGEAVKRGDVARHFKNESAANSGFDLTADLSSLAPGDYQLSLTYGARGTSFKCDKAKRIRIARMAPVGQ